LIAKSVVRINRQSSTIKKWLFMVGVCRNPVKMKMSDIGFIKKNEPSGLKL